MTFQRSSNWSLPRRSFFRVFIGACTLQSMASPSPPAPPVIVGVDLGALSSRLKRQVCGVEDLKGEPSRVPTRDRAGVAHASDSGGSWSLGIRRAISTATCAASRPLWPCSPPARAMASLGHPHRQILGEGRRVTLD